MMFPAHQFLVKHRRKPQGFLSRELIPQGMMFPAHHLLVMHLRKPLDRRQSQNERIFMHSPRTVPLFDIESKKSARNAVSTAFRARIYT